MKKKNHSFQNTSSEVNNDNVYNKMSENALLHKVKHNCSGEESNLGFAS